MRDLTTPSRDATYPSQEGGQVFKNIIPYDKYMIRGFTIEYQNSPKTFSDDATSLFSPKRKQVRKPPVRRIGSGGVPNFSVACPFVDSRATPFGIAWFFTLRSSNSTVGEGVSFRQSLFF